MKSFNDELKFSSTWYCVKPFFWKHDEILSDYFKNSKTRLVHLLNKFNPDLLANSNKIINLI